MDVNTRTDTWEMNIACIHKDFFQSLFVCNRRESSHGKHLGKCSTMHRSYLHWRKIISPSLNINPKLLLDIKNGTFTRKVCSFLSHGKFRKETKTEIPLAVNWVQLQFCAFMIAISTKSDCKTFLARFRLIDCPPPCCRLKCSLEGDKQTIGHDGTC